MSKGKLRQPFDTRGGKIVIGRQMINSSAYLSLNSNQKVLMLLLQEQWRPDRPVDYGVREAAEKVGCRINTAGKAFNVLQERGFIVCVELSQFNSRKGSGAVMAFNLDAI